MPTLDHCINAIFEPGNIGSSSGLPPTVISPGSIYTPDTFPWDDSVQYSHQFQFFYNSMIHHHRVR